MYYEINLKNECYDIRMNKRSFCFFCLLIAVVIVALSCVLIVCGEYRRFVLRDELAQCSFEYPSSYSWATTYNSNNESVSISSGLFSGGKDNTEVDSSIHFHILKKNNSFPDYKTLLEFTLDDLKRGSGEFKLLERSEFTIAGIQGEKICYNYSRIREERKTKKQYLVPSIAYGGYFENNGILWEIIVDAIMEKSKFAEAAFDHIVSSFEFID